MSGSGIGTIITSGATYGDYSIAPSDFTLAQIRQAINTVLEESRYMLTNSTLNCLANTEEYALPTGVTQDVRRVEIATSNAAPYGWYPHRAWEVVNGYLKFLRWVPSGTNPIRIHYVGNLTALAALTTAIPITIDTNHLKWKTIAFLYKRFYDNTKGDHPEKQALLEEARMQAERAAGAAGEPFLLPRDPIMGDVRA